MSSLHLSHTEFNRICTTATTSAASILHDPPTWTTATRASQLDLDSVASLERAIASMTALLGIAYRTREWTVGSVISHEDVTRWEDALTSIGTVSATGTTLRIEMPAPSPEIAWSVTDRDTGTAYGSGRGMTAVTLVRIPVGADIRLELEPFGFGFGLNYSMSSNRTVDLSSYLCVATISSDRPIRNLTLRGIDVALSTSTTATAVLTRTSTYGSALEMIADVDDSPAYGGVASGCYWEWADRRTLLPSSATMTISLSAVRTGVATFIPSEGTLSLPSSARFEVWAISIGEDGSVGSGSAGQGGRGGGVARAESVLDGEYTTTIATKRGDRTSLWRSGSTVVSASGYGATGGGRPGSSVTYQAGPYCGGGGGGGASDSSAGAGGLGGTGGGAGGAGGQAGSAGTAVDGWSAAGGRAGFVYSTWIPGGGGGGGYGADGGNGGGYAGGGGGGGGVLGGRGGDGHSSLLGSAPAGGGLGYGAGGGGVWGGGGGGLGPFIIASDGDSGGRGAPGAIRIRWLSDASMPDI